MIIPVCVGVGVTIPPEHEVCIGRVKTEVWLAYARKSDAESTMFVDTTVDKDRQDESHVDNQDLSKWY